MVNKQAVAKSEARLLEKDVGLVYLRCKRAQNAQFCAQPVSYHSKMANPLARQQQQQHKQQSFTLRHVLT